MTVDLSLVVLAVTTFLTLSQKKKGTSECSKGLEEQRSRIIFATDGTISYQWKNQEGEEDQRTIHMPLEEVLATTQGDPPQRRRMHTQELIRHILILCVARAPQGRARRGNMARQVLDPLPNFEKEEEQGATSMAPANEALCRKDC